MCLRNVCFCRGALNLSPQPTLARYLTKCLCFFSWRVVWRYRRNANELGSIEPSLAASLGDGGDGEGQRVIHGALRFDGVADPTFPPELRKLTLALVDEFESLQVRYFLIIFKMNVLVPVLCLAVWPSFTDVLFG